MTGFTYNTAKLSVDGCKEVIVSEIEEDVDTGVYARLVSFYIDDAAVVNRRPVLEIYITDTEKGSLEITTPNLTY